MCDIKNRPTTLATIFLAHMEGEENRRREGEHRAILIGRRVSARTHTHTHTHTRTQQCNLMMHIEKIQLSIDPCGVSYSSSITFCTEERGSERIIHGAEVMHFR